MNIHTAAGYAQHGYRIRRSTWVVGEVIGKSNGFFWHCYSMATADGRVLPVSSSWYPNIDDLTSNDWEIVLDGIISDYGQVIYEERK